MSVPALRVCACGREFEVPDSRPTWAKCIYCALTPGPVRARSAPPATYETHPPWATLDVCTFTVPGMPVSKNRVYRVAYAQGKRPKGRQAWIYLTDDARRFIATVQAHAQGTFARQGIGTWDRTRRFSLELQTYFDNPRADVGMALTLVQDALEGVLYTNDNQVIETSDRKELVAKGQARLIVTVRAQPTPQPQPSPASAR